MSIFLYVIYLIYKQSYLDGETEIGRKEGEAERGADGRRLSNLDVPAASATLFSTTRKRSS